MEYLKEYQSEVPGFMERLEKIEKDIKISGLTDVSELKEHVEK